MLKITDLRVITVRPTTENLVIVRIDTSEPGLYGLGDATFTQRYAAVVTVLETYFKPLLIGRDPRNIEDIFRLLHHNGYWRNGPISNNAISGVDMALWDIKGKLANMPVYQLLGGKCRPAAAIYRHAQGATPDDALASVRQLLATGATNIRVQMAAPVSSQAGPAQARAVATGQPAPLQAAMAGYGGKGYHGVRCDGVLPGPCIDIGTYITDIDDVLSHVRANVGPEVNLLHDVHSRLMPADVIQLAKRLEKHRLFFLEDPLPPEQLHWLPRLRDATTLPIAIGELFVHPAEWVGLIDRHEIDFVRMHISAVGGVTPARKIAAHAEMHDVRTAWHCPKDIAPIGVAANVALDVSCPNFGIQEFAPFTDPERELFSGLPELRGGYLYPTEAPGWGITINEDLVAKYPPVADVIEWTQVRGPDGCLIRP